MSNTSMQRTFVNTQAAESALDETELLHRCRGRADLAAGLARLFREIAPSLLDSLRAAILAKDLKTAASKAHALKGNAASVSAKPLAAVASEVDRCVRAQGTDGLASGMSRLEVELGRAVAALLVFESTCAKRAPEEVGRELPG